MRVFTQRIHQVKARQKICRQGKVVDAAAVVRGVAVAVRVANVCVANDTPLLFAGNRGVRAITLYSVIYSVIY